MLCVCHWQITFTKTFVQHYAFIMKTLMKSHESDTMSNRIVHISVQLFSNEELARRVTEECHLLDIMVTVLLYMMESCLIKSELQGKLSECVRFNTPHHTQNVFVKNEAGCCRVVVVINQSSIVIVVYCSTKNFPLVFRGIFCYKLTILRFTLQTALTLCVTVDLYLQGSKLTKDRSVVGVCVSALTRVILFLFFSITALCYPVITLFWHPGVKLCNLEVRAIVSFCTYVFLFLCSLLLTN